MKERLKGSKSNNTVYAASLAGKIKKVVCREGKGGYQVVIEESSEGREVSDIIPPGSELMH